MRISTGTWEGRSLGVVPISHTHSALGQTRIGFALSQAKVHDNQSNTRAGMLLDQVGRGNKGSYKTGDF